MTPLAWLTLGVFIATYLGMAIGGLRGLRIDRAWIALAAASVLLISGAQPVTELGHVLDASALLLLFALMVISAQFELSGLYLALTRWMVQHAQRPAWLLAGVVVLGGGLSALLVNDIVAFALAPMLCAALLPRGLDPRPFLIALACACNAGSAATLIGNPQNILIGQAGELDFWPFLAVCGPPALASLGVVYAVVWLQWRERWATAAMSTAQTACDALPQPTAPSAAARAKALLAMAALLILFATPIPRELAALAVAVVVMASRHFASRAYLNRVDWGLLVLFMGLFVVTGAFAELPTVRAGAERLIEMGLLPDGAGSLAIVSLVASNLIGNVPFVMLLLSLWPEASDAQLHALALMSTLAGNLLLVGSVVNLIVAESARRAGLRLGFAAFARIGVPVTLLSMAIAYGWLVLGGWLPA